MQECAKLHWHEADNSCISLRSRLHPSPPSAVPGSVGVAHKSPPGQTDWGQNEWDELKQLLVHPPPLCITLSHAMEEDQSGSRFELLDSAPPWDGGESSRSPAKGGNEWCIQGQQGKRSPNVQTFSFFLSLFLLTFSTSYFQLTVSAACVYLTESFLSVLSLFTFSQVRRVKAFTHRGRDD